MSPVLVTVAILGQMKLTKPQAAKAAELFGLSKTEQALLNEIPHRGSQMPPTDPLIYRFYELVMVNGLALKVLIEEELGEGKCRQSISTWRWNASLIPKATGSKSPCRENSCRTRREWKRANLRVQGGIGQFGCAPLLCCANGFAVKAPPHGPEQIAQMGWRIQLQAPSELYGERL
jgi:hypothetical protein